MDELESVRNAWAVLAAVFTVPAACLFIVVCGKLWGYGAARGRDNYRRWKRRGFRN